MQKNEVGPPISHSKCIICLNVKAKTIKLSEENTEINLHDLGLGDGFLDITLKV